MIVLPVQLICYDLLRDYYQFKPNRFFQLFEMSLKKSISWLPYLMILVFYFVLRKLVLGNFAGGYGDQFDMNIKFKLFCFIEYMRFSFLASPFDFNRYFFTSPSSFDWKSPTWEEVFMGIFILLTILLPLIITGLRNIVHSHLFVFGILWFGISFIPFFFSNVVMAFYLYLPMVGISCALIALIFSLHRRSVALLISVLLILTYGTYQFKYNSDWVYAGSIAKNIRGTVEAATANFQKGDTIVLVDVPGYYKSAWVLWGNIENLLRKPFNQSDIFDDFNVKVFSSNEIRLILKRQIGQDNPLPDLELVKSILEVTPMFCPDLVGLEVKSPNFFLHRPSNYSTNLFRWNPKTSKLENVFDLNFIDRRGE